MGQDRRPRGCVEGEEEGEGDKQTGKTAKRTMLTV